MPFIRVTYAAGALNCEQKAKLSPLLIEGVMNEELDPITENSIAMTPVVFTPLDKSDFYPGGKAVEDPMQAFIIVEVVVAAAFFNQARRDTLQAAIGKAFTDVLGDDGSEVWRDDLRFAPSYLLKIHTVLMEIPEGSWGLGGRTLDSEKIIKVLGNGVQKKERIAELDENVAKMRAARVS